MTEDHYFSAEPASQDERFPLSVRLAGFTLNLEGAPGVFSHDRLDLGTAVLLDRVPAPPKGNLLDLGCGWGAIALTMGLLQPDARIWAVDVNRRALDLTRRNAESVGQEHPLAPISALPPDHVPPLLRFEAIWSNPPIRIGKEALHALLASWLPRLTSRGEAYLVVQRNLGSDSLAAWMSAQVGDDGRPWGSVDRIASSKGFRILRLTRS
ncbi:MAG: methyltransferase [Demequinaceae bacterium]|nr:methyltransferase [Demequinaceae bacterium]